MRFVTSDLLSSAQIAKITDEVLRFTDQRYLSNPDLHVHRHTLICVSGFLFSMFVNKSNSFESISLQSYNIVTKQKSILFCKTALIFY